MDLTSFLYYEFFTSLYFLSVLQDEQGQDLIEYTLLLAFIALASASIFVSVGNSATTIWGAASNQLSNAATSAS